MEEAIVSAVVQTLGTLLIPKTISFITSFTGMQEQFKHLREEFVSIQGFLSIAVSNHNQDPDIRAWVSDVRDIAYDVEDVIDDYLHMPKNALKCYKLNKKMEYLLLKLKEISKRRKRYDGITTQRSISSNTRNTNDMRLLRRVYSHTPDDVTIGLEEQTNELVTKLLQEEDQLCIVSIYGMGGLGKTTLAKKVYNLHDVKSHFDCYAWTSISQQMRTKEVLKEIIRKVNTQASGDIIDMNEAELVGTLFRFLDGKRYLVVLDDIWSTKDWDVIKPAFPNSKGSKIMFTTRNKKVAENAQLWSYHYEPRSLTDEEAWELLCKKAFPSNVMDLSYSISTDMEKCGRDMVKKFGGLPLAIVVFGGLLASKRSLNEWETVHKQIGMVGMESGKDDVVLSILSLSYLELPYHLKPLFLYLGLFPEDSNIRVKKLLRMWMAENLIKKEGGETIEEAGRRYLSELINRCMVQIDKKSLGGGRPKTCRLHDEMRDLCIDIGKKENFFEVASHQNNDSATSSSSSSLGSKLRRCAIYVEEKGNQYVFPNHLTPCLRTVFFIPNGSFNYFPDMVYKDFKLLKVLVFQGYIKVGMEVSRVIGKLCNLRYLDLGRGEHYCMDNELPQLRHLYGLFLIRSKISKMTELQSVSVVQAGPWMQYLGTLTNLEKLGIWGLNEETIGMLTIVINRLDKLQSLYLRVNESLGSNYFSELLEALFESRHLLKLRLLGRINSGKLPSHVPSNLIKLSLRFSNLSEDPMPTLEKLQQLLFLELFNSYSGKQMVCSANGFPQLCFLTIAAFNCLEEWTIEEGAMPCLKTCRIYYCKKLKMVPQGCKFLTMIQELNIEAMTESFDERVKEGGEDWETIKHIPSITVTKDYY